MTLLLTLLLVLQTPTVNARLVWDPNPAIDAVLFYTIQVDDGAPVNMDATQCTATSCELPLQLTLVVHRFAVTATNEWGTSLPATLTRNLRAPDTPKDLRVIKVGQP